MVLLRNHSSTRKIEGVEVTPEEIQAEWDAFIDYPEGSGKLYVTTTSALIFARSIVKMAESRLEAEVARLKPLQYRQAPCYKFCESNAYEIEIRKLIAEVVQMSALAQDRLEQMESDRKQALVWRDELAKLKGQA